MSSLSDLHHRLGKLIEYRPGHIARPEPGSRATYNSDERPLEGLALDCFVRPLSGAGQLEIDIAREEMGEAVWAALNAEWIA